VPKINWLKAEVTLCKQGNLEVVKYFSTLMGLCNGHDTYVKHPTCMCEVAAKYAKMVEDDKDHEFLISLDDELYLNVWP